MFSAAAIQTDGITTDMHMTRSGTILRRRTARRKIRSAIPVSIPMTKRGLSIFATVIMTLQSDGSSRRTPAKDGLNWYAYCGNNPINCVDPLGLYKLERDEDGEIYAIIEKGDSLSKIAIDQVNDASAWKKMKYDGNPNEIQIGQRINITGIYNQQYPAYNVVANVDKLKDKIRSSAKSLPFFGTPNSTRVLYNPDGTPK